MVYTKLDSKQPLKRRPNWRDWILPEPIKVGIKKLKIIDAIDNGMSERNICSKFKTSKGVIARIKKHKDEILTLRNDMSSSSALKKEITFQFMLKIKNLKRKL